MKPASLIMKSKGHKGFLTSKILWFVSVGYLCHFDKEKSLKIVKKLHWYSLYQRACLVFLFWFMVLYEIILVMVLQDLKYTFCWPWAISTPGSSDALQYFWIIQFGCIIAGSLNGKQFFTLFPNQFGFLIGNDFK